MNRANESFGLVKNGLDEVKSVSYEKFQMNLDKMDELAGYNISGKTSKLQLRGCNAYQPDLSRALF